MTYDRPQSTELIIIYARRPGINRSLARGFLPPGASGRSKVGPSGASTRVGPLRGSRGPAAMLSIRSAGPAPPYKDVGYYIGTALTRRPEVVNGSLWKSVEAKR